MLYDLQYKAAQGARRAALGAAGVTLIGVGTGFLTVAAWLVLSALRDAQFAALVIGLVYFGAGGIFVAMSMRPRIPSRSAHVPNVEPTTQAENIAAAFFRGFQTGKDFRN